MAAPTMTCQILIAIGFQCTACYHAIMDSQASGAKTGGLQREYVPLYTRIKRLRHRAEMSMLFWKYVPSILLLLIVLVRFGGFMMNSMFAVNGVIAIGFVLLVGIWLAEVVTYNVYLHTSSYMYQTNLPVLLADEQFLRQFQQPDSQGTRGWWQKVICPRDSVQQLIVGSAHKAMLRDLLSGNNEPPPKMAIDSSCLWLSGTATGQGLAGASTVVSAYAFCCCSPSGYCLFPVWFYYIFTLFCRQASIVAVCDYFLGTPRYPMHKLEQVGRYYVDSVATQGKPEEVGLREADSG